MKKIYYLCLAIFFITKNLSAQDHFTIHGHIKDALNGEVLIGVNIFIPDLQIFTNTNAYGYYALALEPGDYTITYSYLGYEQQTKNFTLEKDIRVDIEMTEQKLDIKEVVVSAKDKKDNVRSTEMSVQKLDMKNIRTIPVVFSETDILKTIQLLPGISSIGDGTSGLYVRGGAADQNLILLDEGTIYNANHLFGFFSVFNADAIKDVKVYKGGIPATYGGRLSSVIDVHQKEGNMRRFGGVAGIGLISSRLLVEAPIIKDKASFLIAGRRSYGDLFLAFSDNDNRAYFYDINAKLNFRFSDKSRLFLSTYLGNDVFTLADLFTNKWGNITATLRWNYIYNHKLFSNLSVIYSQYDYNFSFDIFKFDWRSTIENLNTKLDYTWFLNKSNQINFGFDVQRYYFNPGVIAPNSPESAINRAQLDKKQAWEYGLYIDNKQKLSSHLSLRYGVRLSSFDRIGPETKRNYADDAPIVYNKSKGKYETGVSLSSQVYASGTSLAHFVGIEPRLNLTYTLTTNSSIKMSYNRINQYIHLVSNTTSPTPLDIWTPSGPYIKPQKVDQAGIGYFRNLDHDRYEFSLELYYKKLYNSVDYIDGAELIANNELETVLFQGDGRAYGVEVLFKKNRGPFKGWLSYTFSKTQRRFKGFSNNEIGVNGGLYYPANNDRPHDVSVTTSYQISPRVRLGSNFIYQTGRPATFPTSKYYYAGFIVPNYENRNQSRLTDYHRLDFSMTLKSPQKENKKSTAEWVFSIYNIYNRKNAISISFSSDEATRDIPQAKRLAFFGILPSLSWNKKF